MSSLFVSRFIRLQIFWNFPFQFNLISYLILIEVYYIDERVLETFFELILACREEENPRKMSPTTATVDDPGQIKRALIDASAGAISGGVSRTVTSPLDVIKIRFQVLLFLFSWVIKFSFFLFALAEEYLSWILFLLFLMILYWGCKWEFSLLEMISLSFMLFRDGWRNFYVMAGSTRTDDFMGFGPGKLVRSI